MLRVSHGEVSAVYDREVDVLYVGVVDPEPSYSIGNPADMPGVEWLVADADPERITGAIVMDWVRTWDVRIPPLPFALSRAVVERGMHGEGGPIDPLREALHHLRSRISIDPAVLGGQPCVTSTRIGVTHVVAAMFADGPEETAAQFPGLSEDDIMACGLFARLLLERPGVGADLLADTGEDGDER